MDNRKVQANAAASPPSVPTSPSSGYFTNGGVSVPVTIPGEWWFHQIGEELRTVITAAGLTPAHNLVNQLLAALNAGWGMGKSFGVNSYVVLPGGLIIQFGTVVTSSSASTSVVYPLTFPNAARSVVGTVGTTSHITFTTNTTTASSFLCDAMSVGGRNAITCSWLAIGN